MCGKKEKEEGSGEVRRKRYVSKGRKRREKCGKKERGTGRGQAGSRVRRKEEGHQRAEEDDRAIRRGDRKEEDASGWKSRKSPG